MNVYRGFLAAISAAVIVASVASCASVPPPTTTYQGNVEALVGKENVFAFNYVILSGNENVANDDIKFEKFKSQIEASLRAKNFFITDDINAANAVIFFTYNVSDPVTTKTETTARSYTPPPIMIGGTAVASPLPATTTISDTYSTTYTRKVVLDAYKFDNVRKVKTAPLWNIELISEGSSNDMRSLFPYYVQMLEKYYGKDSDGRKQVVVTCDEKGDAVERNDEKQESIEIGFGAGGNPFDDR